MRDVVKEASAPEERRHTIRWPAEEWAELERAADKLSKELRIPIAPVDLIRGAALSRAAEILSSSAA